MNDILDVVVYESLRFNRKIASNNSTITVEFYRDITFPDLLSFYEAILTYLLKENLHKIYILESPRVLKDNSVLFKISKIKFV